MVELAPRPSISPTQLATAGKCGWAYEYAYKQRRRPASLPAVLIAGSVLHHAREKWALNHDLDMVELVQDAWLALTVETPLHSVVTAYTGLCRKSLTLQRTIRLARPDIKKPTATKEFKQSPLAKTLMQFLDNHRKQLSEDKYDWSVETGKKFTEVYDSTIQVAEAYQERYRDSPTSLITEIRYTIQHGDLLLGGIIDDVSVVISTDGEPLGYGIWDAKSYTQEPEPMKDFLQLANYHIAAMQLLPVWLEDLELPFNPDWPIFVGLDLMTLLQRPFYQFGPQQLDIATKLLRVYDRHRQLDEFLPNFKGKCDWCEWITECRERVGMFPLDVEIL